MKTLILLVSFLLSFNLLAAPKKPWLQVLKMKGEVTYNGSQLEKDQKVKKSGVLKTGAKSFVKILIGKWKNTIVLGPNSTMDIDVSKPQVNKKASHIYTFKNGICRWISGKGNKGKGKIKTRVAILGVRGTDFVLTSNEILGESEIVVLDGAVMFVNKKNKADSRLVSKGQWGGLGGRYGQSIEAPLNLPKVVLDQYENTLKH